MNIGIYQIRNLINDKLYIGSAAGKHGFSTRWNLHRHELRHNKHDNQHLQRAWNKYDEPAFIFEVIEYVVRLDEMTDEEWKTLILQREQYYLDVILFARCNDQRFKKLGYNICRIANSRLGVKASQETKKLMSINHTSVIGNKNPNAKLTNDDIYKIRYLLLQGITQNMIAQQFNVTQKTISEIKNYKKWQHI